MAGAAPITSPDTPVSVKITFAGTEEHKKIRLTLKDLGSSVLPDKLRELLAVEPTKDITFERYSDSSASYIIIDSSNQSVYKQLYRAAKAKGKLRLRVSIKDKPTTTQSAGATERSPNQSYVRPYVTDGPTEQSPSSRISMLEDFKTLSEAPSMVTLTSSKKAEDDSEKTPPRHFWPVVSNGDFSDNTKARFEKKPAVAPACPYSRKLSRKDDEAPVPGFFDFNDEQFLKPSRRTCPAQAYLGKSARESKLARLGDLSHHTATAKENIKADFPSNVLIQCNQCDAPVPDVHWHCSICDEGDYDICPRCIDKGFSCQNEKHWLIKRFLKGGHIIASTTETIPPKRSTAVEGNTEIPGAFKSEIKAEVVPSPERTCNSCVQVFPEAKFVTCKACEDFDLCEGCHIANKHGHHPGHIFEQAVPEATFDIAATRMLGAGRDYAHFAICDGCEKNIFGVRHKCLNCPDWDFCSSCARSASVTHPRHRFIQLYEPIQVQRQSAVVHHGICCDGPLCEGKSCYITGDRYKCAVCHDTDFCARCEAVPTLNHNKTHPLLKFKTPVRNVSVSTYGEKANGEAMRPMGDQSRPTSSKSTETNPPAPSSNAATQVHTVAEVKPSGTSKGCQEGERKAGMASENESLKGDDTLLAEFVSDTVVDGSTVAPRAQFAQTWTLSNPGPRPWPADCAVCYVGGDSMINVDTNTPASVDQLQKALRTNSIDREVLSGEKVTFSITMRASEREGKAISYWRLKTPDGMPFGHRLWCDVKIRKASDETDAGANDVATKAAPESETAGSQMIFPKLEKESPVSSQCEEAGVPAPPVVTGATLLPAEQDLLEDVESLELEDNDESSEEGYLTDEEYELIASGDEMEAARNGKK